METPKENELLTVDETMAFLRVSRSTLYRLLQRGELSGYKVARKWMFDLKDLQAFLASRRVAPAGLAHGQDQTALAATGHPGDPWWPAKGGDGTT